jgi:carboxypeptidase C (cathepsin A)
MLEVLMTEETKTTDENKEKKIPEEKTSVTEHTLLINGHELAYTVTAGTLLLKEEDEKEGEKPKAMIFYVAYQLHTDQPVSQRPITFSFNGGPGSSSVWMHLGLLGPKRVLMDEEGMPLPPPYRLVPNDFTLLDKTDLVFIDPVSTGFSRTVPGEKAEVYHNVKKDVESVGDFIQRYTTRSKRWGSPKFLIGESYGTTRAAGLAGYLQERHGMYLNGIMLVSSILNFGTARFNPGNDLPYVLFLPTYTATAWYHHKLSLELQADLQGALRQSEHFAATEYTLALVQGSQLPEDERRRIVSKLAALTGLSEDYIERTDLRIDIHRFCKELCRREGLTVGRLDSRYTGRDRDSAGELYERDPSSSATLGPYTAMLNDYVRSELDFESDLTYEVLTSLFKTWKYDDFQNQYVNTGETLREGFLLNPAMKVFVANGYYDLATPYFATRYTLNHLGLPAEFMEKIQTTYYQAGHMMYLHLPSLAKLKQDLDAFIDSAMPH